MVVYAYSGGQRKALIDPSASVGGVKVPVQAIWAYTGGQRYLVWARTPVTLTAAAQRWDVVKITWTPPGTGADSYRLYRGGTLVYSGAGLTFTDTRLNGGTAYGYRVEALRAGDVVGDATGSVTTPAITMTLTATAVSQTQINLSWTCPDGVDRFALHSSVGFVGHFAGSARSGSHTGLAAGTGYNYRIEAERDVIVAQAWASATTSAPVYQDRVWEGWAVESASYNGSNQRRTDGDGLARCYYGEYSSTHGSQKSQVRFNIPTECRSWGGCVEVTRVQIRWWNQHHFLNAGGRVSMVAHHNGSLGSYGGNTGVLLDGGAQVRWPAPKPGWINGTEWYDLAWLTSSGRPSIAEEIRVQGLQGFGLVPAYGGQDGYGYASTDALLRISYRVRVA